ncbi:MAG TPA: hydrogenase maturation protease [Noviherbaspirillum sp.]|uniref:hydrogenase maturation protease n=1 Tax=Noviherbaspirillum sp. TaxID=1926288 RepID=UPI002B4803D8|nr:hydrogenase maturation protease [Noviherbaspirillum sp.]HJV84598.1 hydrogenase maturation protease [Noviherbaspirillum sp.]
MRHVICFGNELHGDDGFGPAVHGRLGQMVLPPDWKAFNAGCRGLDALALFQCDEVIVVDAAAPAGQPGRLGQPELYEIDAESVLAGHDAGVGYLLQALAAMDGRLPALRILTAEMAAVTPFRPGLSAQMAGAVDGAVNMLCAWMQGRDRNDKEGEESSSRMQQEEQ